MEFKKIARPFAGKQIPLLGDRLATLASAGGGNFLALSDGLQTANRNVGD
jgi:hypothetical protein